jgi:LPXTG-motif cell wall-anchored protein
LVPGYEEGVDGVPTLVEVSKVETVPRGGSVTLDFELTVEGEPPADATFFGVAGVDLEDIWLDEPVQLADPAGDGVYNGSMNVPTGSTVTAWITQGTGTHEGHNGTLPGEPFTIIKHLGMKSFSKDATFEASVSLPGNGTPLGGISGGIQDLLPSTGGDMTRAILGAGVLLVSGGFLTHRLAR